MDECRNSAQFQVKLTEMIGLKKEGGDEEDDERRPNRNYQRSLCKSRYRVESKHVTLSTHVTGGEKKKKEKKKGITSTSPAPQPILYEGGKILLREFFLSPGGESLIIIE